MNPLSGLIGKVLAALGVLFGILGAIFAYGRQRRSEGRREAEHEQMEKTIEAVQEKSRLDSELTDADARRELREKHYRD